MNNKPSIAGRLALAAAAAFGAGSASLLDRIRFGQDLGRPTKPAESARGIGRWLGTSAGRSLCASRSGKTGTVAQDKRRALKARNRKRNRK